MSQLEKQITKMRRGVGKYTRESVATFNKIEQIIAKMDPKNKNDRNSVTLLGCYFFFNFII